MIEIRTDGQGPDDWQDKREPLFSIDDREYTIPVEVPGNISLQAIEVVRQQGDTAATGWLMELMLGADGYRALRKCPAVDRAQIKRIGAIIRDKVLGDLEDEEGK
jgi:hypothetical protein